MKFVATTLVLLALSFAGCQVSGHKNGPCTDTATVIGNVEHPAECHPQASIAATPIGSAGIVLVTCRCNILPNPEPMSCPFPDAGAE